MRRVVIDASAFVAWFTGDERSTRREYESGELGLIVPTTFATDVMGVAASQDWSAQRLERIGRAVQALGLEQRDPSVDLVARWLAIGLPPRLATYAALAEETERPLVAADPELRRRAGPVLGR